MENKVESKQAHWKSIKDDFMALIPWTFTLSVKGLEDESDYYHPIIQIDDTIFIHSQCDLKTNHVYALRINIEHLNNHMFALSIEPEQLNFILSNWVNVKDRILKSIEMTKAMFEMQELINKAQQNIMYCAISEIEDKTKIKQVKDAVFQITEFIENNRLSY